MSNTSSRGTDGAAFLHIVKPYQSSTRSKIAHLCLPELLDREEQLKELTALEGREDRGEEFGRGSDTCWL